MPLTILDRSRPETPGYFRPADEGIGLLDWDETAARFAAAKNYWISTASTSGRPHAMPVWGVWLGDRFVFSTSPASRKARNLRANPQVAVHLEDGNVVIVVEGRAAELRDRTELLAFLDDLQSEVPLELHCGPGRRRRLRRAPGTRFRVARRRRRSVRRHGDALAIRNPPSNAQVTHADIEFRSQRRHPHRVPRRRSAATRCCCCTASPARSSTSTISCSGSPTAIACSRRTSAATANRPTSASPDAYSFDILVEDLAGYLDALDVQRCHLLGHSMGGMVAMRFALRYPERLTSLILMDTAAEPLTIFPQALREQLGEGRTRQRLREPRQDDARNADERRAEARRRFPRRRRTLAPHRTEAVADGPRSVGRARRRHGETGSRCCPNSAH